MIDISLFPVFALGLCGFLALGVSIWPAFLKRSKIPDIKTVLDLPVRKTSVLTYRDLLFFSTIFWFVAAMGYIRYVLI